MILEKLKLHSYRNLTGLEIAWNEHFNVIYGLNAQGKTNLLEAIYLRTVKSLASSSTIWITNLG